MLKKTSTSQIILTPEIIEDFSRLPEKPVVSIVCLTYNHERFIEEAIEGFLMQETDFPIEILIHDDASTDRTTEIVRQYQIEHPDLIRLIIQRENRFSKGLKSSPIPMDMAKGKYIALCEGDDYWTDRQKLQKQVDFLEVHPDCSISCHKVLYKFESQEKKSTLFPSIDHDGIFSTKDFSAEFFPKTLSVVFRNQKMQEFLKFQKDFLMGDTPLLYFYSQFGNIGYSDDVMATYRIHSNGIWSPKTYLEKKVIEFDAHEKLREKLSIDASDLNLIWKCLNIIECYKSTNNKRGMRKYIFYCLRYLNLASENQKQRLIRYIRIAFIPKCIRKALLKIKKIFTK